MLNGLSLTWTWQPAVTLVLLLLSLLYLLGIWQARRRWLREPLGKPLTIYRIAAFFGAMLLLVLILASPLSAIGRTQLFFVHAFQIVVITSICSPLILAACPAVILRPLQETPVVREIMRFLVSPLVASLLFNINFLIWHAPRLYSLVMADSNLYQLMLLLIFLTSLLHWFPLMGSLHEWRGMSYLLQALYAFLDGQPADIFAVVLAVNSAIVYPYAIPPQLGLTASIDQIAGAGLLLIPGIIDLIVMSPLFIRWLGQLEERTRQADQKRLEALEMAEEDDEEDR